MKKIFTIIIMQLFTNIILFADWEHKFSTNSLDIHVQMNDDLFIGRKNGLTKFNLKSKDLVNFTILNSELPGHNFNSFLQIFDNQLLISTKQGLCIYKDGKISVNNPICKNYPDTDSRNLYLDKKGRIWTYSANKVYFYEKDNWKTIMLKDSIPYNFDIWDLSFTQNNVWVIYNDMTESKSHYYNKNLSDLSICIAICNDTKINKIFDTMEEFPQQKGDYSIFSFGDVVYWKNSYDVYKYQNNEWNYVFDFNYNKHQPVSSQKIYGDTEGNIWYTVSDPVDFTAFPVSYNISTGELKTHLRLPDDAWINKLEYVDNKIILAQSDYCIYMLKDTGWVRIAKNTLKLPKQSRIEKFLYIDNKIFAKISFGLNFEEDLMCLEGENLNILINQNFPFSSLDKVEIDKFGKGIFRGINNNIYRAMIEKDSGFESILEKYSSEFRTVDDGSVYYTQRDKFIYTWEDNDIKTINMGFDGKLRTEILKFDFFGDFIIALGQYEYHEDSLNSYISIYNTKDGSLKLFDKNNSDLPDYYFYMPVGGAYSYPKDTIPVDIAIDKDFNSWLLTSESLFKFKEDGSEFIDLKYNNSKIICDRLLYDQHSNEILLFSNYTKQIYSVNPETKLITFLDSNNTGIIGKITKIKKLIDYDVWAADDLGYLYKYAGNGKFDNFDLIINGRKNLRIPINDFSMDFNRNLHLACEIGLLTNNSILSNVAENSKISRDEFNIYPNPAGDFITINFKPSEGLEPSEGYNIQIFNTLGIEVGQSSLIVNPNNSNGQAGMLNLLKIDISHLSAGLYFVRIGERVEKFVKM